MQDFDVAEEQQCFVRDTPAHGLLLPSTTSHSIHGNTPNVTVLGPGNMAVSTHQHPQVLPNGAGDSRPLTERLMEADLPNKVEATSTPSAESLTQLLVQSVTSGDGKLLEEVLRVTKEKIVTATVRKIPIHVVLPFTKQVSGHQDLFPRQACSECHVELQKCNTPQHFKNCSMEVCSIILLTLVVI